MVLCSRSVFFSGSLPTTQQPLFLTLETKYTWMGYKRWVDAFIRGHSPGDSANLESGPFQASQAERKLFLKSISLTPFSPFAADGHRSSFGESLWGSGHSLDLDAEILPALTVCQDDVLVRPPCRFKPLFTPMLSSDPRTQTDSMVGSGFPLDFLPQQST